MSTTFCLFVVPLADGKEPVYKDQPLSEWLLVMESQHWAHHHEIPAGMEQPENAIRQMGTNAIPVLLDILGATDGNKWWVLEKLKSRNFRKTYNDPAANLDILTKVAVDGFGILGTNAASAVPQMTKLLHKYDSCSVAAQALALVGPKGIAALTNGLSDANGGIRGGIIWVIGEKAPMDSNTVARLMIGCLKDPYNRGEAARYLGGKDPALAIPALLPLLDEDTNFDVIVGASRALSSYGAAAEIAVPKLLSIFTNHVVEQDRNSAINWSVELMRALKGIDTDAAAKADAFCANSGPLGASYGYTTTLLPNGKTLIAGGFIPSNTNHVTSIAMLFDPATRKWAETASMNVARYCHTATLLSNGKVLVAGGSDLVARGQGGNLTSAELYDPATGKWTITGSMKAASSGAQAVLQPDGKVRIPACYEGDQKRPGDNLYDPATGTWTVVTNK